MIDDDHNNKLATKSWMYMSVRRECIRERISSSLGKFLLKRKGERRIRKNDTVDMRENGEKGVKVKGTNGKKRLVR